MNDHVIFDISQKGYDWFPICIGLLFIIGAAIGMLSPQSRKTLQIVPALLLLFGVLLSLGMFLFQYTNHQRYQAILDHGQYSVVEGTAERFHPMSKAGHGNETFTINGVSFSYSDFSVTPAFNTTSVYGGPIHEGMYLKIYYTKSIEFAGDYAILRIEARKQN
jgi:hypothetical protein